MADGVRTYHTWRPSEAAEHGKIAQPEQIGLFIITGIIIMFFFLLIYPV